MLDKKIFKVLAVLILATSIFLMWRDDRDAVISLKKNAYVSFGYLEKLVPRNSKGLGGQSFIYTYNYKGKTYRTQSLSYYFINNINYSSKLIGKSFPIVLDSTDPYNSRLLLTRGRLSQFGLPFPDSLKWVSQYVQ